ncbi:hypothetical protein ACLMJK_001601 [Lecanora helva]
MFQCFNSLVSFRVSSSHPVLGDETGGGAGEQDCMPRLENSLLRTARQLHPLLPTLLRPCRDLESARNELRWLREHAVALDVSSNDGDSKSIRPRWQHILREFCYERGRGKPLQYILGTQPFGGLEMLCRPKVLIPRAETESITTRLASILPRLLDDKSPQSLRILDLCTGTGCISYLLYSLLSPTFHDLRLCAVDVSSAATKLTRDNLEHNIRLGHLPLIARKQISSARDDIFDEEGDKAWRNGNWDVVVSNPPYLSNNAFDKDTSRSVRNFEPRIALMPTPSQMSAKNSPSNGPIGGDAFFPRLLQIAQNADARVLLLEVADMDQAVRVGRMVLESGIWSGCEIWRDWDDGVRSGKGERMEIGGKKVEVKGEGHGRAVLAWRRDGGRIVGDVG